jgi:type IV secretory pathway TrbD component
LGNTFWKEVEMKAGNVVQAINNDKRTMVIFSGMVMAGVIFIGMLLMAGVIWFIPS